MVDIIWSPGALRDLQGILEYIAKDAPVAAKRFGEKILARTRQLRTSPLLGGFILEDPSQTYRELIQGNYRVIYRCDDGGNVVYVVTVHHAARLLDPGRLN